MSKHSLKTSPNKKSIKHPNLPSLDVKYVQFKVLPSPTKSTRDKKEFKVIQLENGLKACLISDVSDPGDDSVSSESDYEESDSDSESDGICEESEPEEVDELSENDNEMKKVPEKKQKMAAAALCVGVGSFSDPPHIPGMAHFLEHMVFMGSEKFPEENDFDKFISKRGGSDNASTDCETTTFYFECLEKYLYRSLDKFAQFFISPLMKQESMTREREAIDSEFQMAIPNDAYRKEQLLASLFNPVVPVNQFTWGNLLTLKENVADEVLYKALHEFHKRHYSAHRMTLCIQARQPIETLEAYVLDCFKKVPSNKLPPLDFKQYSDIIYDTPDFNKIYYVIPTKNVVQLDLIWALPSLLHLYKSKPHQYVSWLLGDEGKGSLISYLRRKVWALAIYTGNGETGSEHNSMYAYFTVTLVLTQNGLQNIYELINYVFSYINLLKKVGPQERVFNEIKLIEDTSFTFADEKLSVDMVENMAESMQFYPSQDYLTGSELYFEYKPEDIQMVLNHLRPDKMNIMVLNNNMPKEIECNLLEPWFKTSYTIKDIPNIWLEKWTNVEPLPEFSLPQPNPFLTTNFTLLPLIKDNPDYPTKVIESASVELWYRLDQKFQTPTAYYYYYLISPLPLETPINSALLDMFIALVAIQMTEEGYPAQVAELDFAFTPGDKGMLLKINGFNEKLPVLLELITKYLKSVSENLTLDMFEAVKENQSMIYYNKFLKPSALNKDMRLSLLLSSYWPPIEKNAAITKISFDMMKNFADNFIKNLYIQGLIQGNVTKEIAISATEKFIDDLGCEPLIANTFPKMRVVQLPKGEHCCRVINFNASDSNSYITNYYQSGPFSIKTSVIIELLMLIIEEPLFDILRTKEQLGYNVFCTLRDTYGILGYSLTVNTQAAKHTTQYIDTRIEAFVKHVQKLLKKMTDKKINQFKRDLIKVKQCTDVLLKEEVSKNWSEIINRDYIFDRLQQEIKAIEELKTSDLKKFWDEHNIYGAKSNFRKLTIQVIGNKTSDSDKNAKSIGNDVEKRYKREAKDLSEGDQNKEDVEFNLRLIGLQKEWNEKQADDYFISNIESFKYNLYLYPSKTTVG